MHPRTLHVCTVQKKLSEKPAKRCIVKGSKLLEMLIYLPCLGATESEELLVGLTLSYGKEKRNIKHENKTAV